MQFGLPKITIHAITMEKEHSQFIIRNIESFSANIGELLAIIKCLRVIIDIICLTEVRHTNFGHIDKDFHDFHI